MSRALLASLALVLGAWPTATHAAAPTSDPCAEARCRPLVTHVRRAGDRRPIDAARVLVVPEAERRPGDVPPRDHLREDAGAPAWVRRGVSGAEGRVVVPDVPQRRVRVVVIIDGFHRLERVIDFAADREPPPLFVEPLDDNPYRTIVSRPVVDATPPPQPVQRSITREEIRTIPGSQGDALRAAQNLPGVARSPGGAGLLVLRGAPPGQSRVWVGEHPVPRAFHILGLSSVVPADLIDSLELVPGNYSARYGDAVGGVVLLQPRRARRDGVHGFAKVDINSSGAMIEAPVGRGGIMVAAQRSYVDGVLRLAEKVDETAVFGLPRYYDYQAQYDVPLGSNTELVARVIGSGDRWTLRTIDAAGNRSTVSDHRDQFHRVDLTLRAHHGPWRMLISPAFRFDASSFEADFGDSKSRQYVTGWRAEVERDLSRRASVTFGADAQLDPFRFRQRQFSGDPDAQGNSQVYSQSRNRGTELTGGVYGFATLVLGPVTLWPGARVSMLSRQSRYSSSSIFEGDEPVSSEVTTRAFAVDPRLVARIDPHERWRVNLGIGSYSQPSALAGSGQLGLLGGSEGIGGGIVVLSAPIRAAVDSAVGSSGINSAYPITQAVHASAGVEWHNDRGLDIGATGFVRSHHEARDEGFDVVASPVEISVPSDADVLAYGGELLVRQRLGTRLYAWAAYTLMRTQTHLGASASQPATTLPGVYDQRHNLILVASYALPRNFRLGGRFRLVSGSPYTPIVGAVHSDFGVQPLYGATNSERFPIFHQLDIRLDKRWILRRAMVIAYIDVQNVYNAQNVEAYIYARDFSRRVGSVGLPILPTLGVRVEW